MATLIINMGESDDGEVTVSGSANTQTPSHDEKYCTECGEVIKQKAQICPECGVDQNLEEDTVETTQTSQLTDRRQYELEKIASKDKSTVALVSFLITPVGYWMVGKKTLAIINLLTLNFLLFGPIVVPIHTYKMIGDAEEELRRAGVKGY